MYMYVRYAGIAVGVFGWVARGYHHIVTVMPGMLALPASSLSPWKVGAPFYLEARVAMHMVPV